MIISVSRRTDIPAFYSPWLVNRLRIGEVLVRNPFNLNQVSRLSLHSSQVDCLVLWTKNPAPLFPYLGEIEDMGHHFYFQFTITACDRAVEPHLPSREDRIETFQELAERIGPERVLWRFDPIVLTRSQGDQEVLEVFADLAGRLHHFTSRCTISLLSLYAKCRRNLCGIELQMEESESLAGLIKGMIAVAGQVGLPLMSCCDPLLRDRFHIEPGCCIDGKLIASLLKRPLAAGRDRGQRPGCGCTASIDIGAYDTCAHGCRYCYANTSPGAAARNHSLHDPAAPLLGPPLTGRERIIDRSRSGSRSPQQNLFCPPPGGSCSG